MVFGIRLKNAENQPISIEDLQQDKIKELMKRLSEIRKKKYQRCKETRYGNLCRAFSEEELRNFFKCCKNPRAFLAFKIMAYLGLRVGEVAVIRVDDINFNKHKIRINTEKAGTIDYLYLHNEVRKLLYSWVQKFQEEILKGEKLRVYILALELSDEIKSITLTFPQDERFEVASQLSRAATSVPTNLAEACGRITFPDFCNFINIAIGSSKEMESLLLNANKTSNL